MTMFMDQQNLLSPIRKHLYEEEEEISIEGRRELSANTDCQTHHRAWQFGQNAVVLPPTISPTIVALHIVHNNPIRP